MMFKLFFTSILLFIALLSATIGSVDALCLPCQAAFNRLLYPGLPRRTVYNPRITTPTATTKWVSGSEATVTWDRDGMPDDADCTILLGYLEPGSENEHLRVDEPLAKSKMKEGKATFTLPKVPPRGNYIIVVMGDSGNHSPMFSIVDGQ